MQITFTPQRRNDALTATVSGEVLTLNGQDIDLSDVTPDQPYDPEDGGFIAGPVIRDTDGQLHVTLILPLGPEPTEAQCWPDPVEVTDGPVPLPE